MLEEIYRILCIFFGPPPKTFDWSYMTKDGEFKELTGLTPQSFYINHVTHQLENMVSLINDPRNPYGRLYTVDRLGNVVGGKEVQYINVPIDDLKKYAARTIASGDPVWFGCDVRKFFHAKSHSMDTKQFDFELVFGVEFNQSKADRLRYGQSLMTHAMMFTAFDGSIEDPKKWRVENSWGDKNNKGFAVMSNDWFENFMYQIVVDKNILSPEHADVFNQKPVSFSVFYYGTS